MPFALGPALLGCLRKLPVEKAWTEAARDGLFLLGAVVVPEAVVSEPEHLREHPALAAVQRRERGDARVTVAAVLSDECIERVEGDEREHWVASNLADVGYGVSQVLPVIVLLHFVPEGSVILCEDPEAHLHPMAQSGLADLFVEVAKKRKLQVLIETHSEHLFRRLQVLMAGAKVSEHDCALYYVERDDPSAKLIELQADEFGRIQNWPENLFGNAVGEAGQQMREMVKRLQATEEKS